jgi:hypothetical protein
MSSYVEKIGACRIGCGDCVDTQSLPLPDDTHYTGTIEELQSHPDWDTVAATTFVLADVGDGEKWHPVSS